MVALFATVAGHLMSIHILINPGGIGMNGTVEITEVMMDRTMENGMEQTAGPAHTLREEGLTHIGVRNG